MKIPVPADHLIAELTAGGAEGLGKRLMTGLIDAFGETLQRYLEGERPGDEGSEC